MKLTVEVKNGGARIGATKDLSGEKIMRDIIPALWIFAYKREGCSQKRAEEITNAVMDGMKRALEDFNREVLQ